MPDDEYTLPERRVRLSEQREARFQRAQVYRERGQRRSVVRSVAGVYSGKGMLAALLLVGIVLVAIRLVADFEVQQDGAVKGNVLHPQGQYGPVAILAGLLGTFFVLSLVAMGGGTRAKLAVIMGGAIVLTLGVRSIGEIEKIGSTFGSIGKISVPQAAGSLPDIYGNPGSSSSNPASTALNAGSNTAQTIAGESGLTYLSPTSLANLLHDLATAAEQATRQIIPGGSTSQIQHILSGVGNELRHLFHL
jgi:hypothetical protein